MKVWNCLIVLFIYLVAGCSTGPQPIHYGEDQCSYCQMAIVDRQYGSEMVAHTGKVFKFDAVECMVNYYQRELTDQYRITQFLVTGFNRPGELIDVSQASFLVSPQLPSPMGMNITAFSDQDKAAEMQSEKNGNIYDWEGLLNNFGNLHSISSK